MRIGNGIVQALLLCALALTAPAIAQPPVTVFVGGAMTTPVKEVGAAFEQSTRTSPVYVSDTTGALQKRLASGERADLIVVTGTAIDVLQSQGRIVAGSRVDLARALIGVGVRAGAASPDISTAEAFTAALLRAATISYVNPASGGTSGTYFEGLLQRLGIAEAMRVPHPGLGGRRRGRERGGGARHHLYERAAAEPRCDGGRHLAVGHPAPHHLLGGTAHGWTEP